MFFFFKQKTAYEMRISDWSSDVCSSDLFNTRYILADPDTAPALDYDGVEGVVAHEYFHNWSGNRITCRDWFQLSLKEGFIVFSEPSFSADTGSPAVKRIEDVRLLRAAHLDWTLPRLNSST